VSLWNLAFLPGMRTCFSASASQMDPQLERLIMALDLILGARNKADYLRYRDVYEALLEGVNFI
jgi:hypothetical protein